jgi:putative Ca2+/H+ antiporter (TMEM165/GDT1 family)
MVFVAQYSDAALVFSGACVGLIAATVVETALGNRLGRALTPRGVRFVSVAVSLLLGPSILVINLLWVPAMAQQV